jgi:hypothetical protein
MARHRPQAVAKRRRGSEDERVSLKPLTYEEAVRGLFAIKPDEENEANEGVDDDARP